MRLSSLRLRRVAAIVALLLAWTVPAAVGAPAAAPPRVFTTDHTAMATEWQLLLYAGSAERAAELSEMVFDEVDRIEALLSNYQPTSELSRINQEAAQHPVTTDPETFAFLQAAEDWSRRSDGAFDLTVGPLMKRWGFFRKHGTVPSAADFAALRRTVGWRNLQLDAASRTVRFRVPGVELDPGGIGKGFAVESALRLLRGEGVTGAMLSAGSSTIGAIGAPPGDAGWRITAHDPWHSGTAVSSVLLRDSTLSTANCAEKNFTLGGKLYCHIMNPHTLRPVTDVQQVTVIDPSGTASDALSNVLFVLPVSKSLRLMQTLPRDSALIVTGTEDRRTCTAIRWRVPIAPGFCARLLEVK